jgi:hypothetical protein
VDIRTFYSLVLPSTGIFCLMSPKAAHYWYDNIDELIAGTEQHTYDEPNWYFGTCGFDGTKRRKQENVVAARSLRLDLDAGEKKLAKHGPEKVYATQKEALAHAVEFIKWTKLKPTIIVSSGEGLHLYYCFDQDFPSMDVWLKCATALEQMAQTFKLKADPSVTKDSARVLRPVGALHSNGKHIKELAVYQQLTLPQFIEAYKVLAPTLVKPAPAAAKPRGINADIQGPVVEVPSSMKVAAEKCGFIRDSLAANGNVDYMPWLNMLALFKYSVEGEDGAHEWSSGHPEYDFGATQAKLDSLDKAPPRCSKISDDNPGCRSCPQFSKNSTPNLFGRLNDRQQIELAKAAKARAEASPASTADSDDGFGSGFTDGGDDAAESDGGGFASFDELPDGDVEAAFHAGKAEEAFKAARAADQTDELIAAGDIPATWLKPQDLRHRSTDVPFFLAKDSENRIMLGCYRKVEIKDETGEKRTEYKKLLLTYNPFCFRDFIGDGRVVAIVHDQYDKHRRNKASWSESEVESKHISDDRELRNWYSTEGVSYADLADEREIQKMLAKYARANLGVLRDQNTGESFKRRLGYQFVNESPVYVQGPYKCDDAGRIERCFLTGPLRALTKAYQISAIPSDDLPGYKGDVYAEKILPSARAYCDAIRQVYGTGAGEASLPHGFAWFLGVAGTYMTFAAENRPSPDADMPGMGFTISLFSKESGFGKSALQESILRAYGDSSASKASGDAQTGASNIAVGVSMANRGSLPYALDEATNRKPEDVSKLVYAVSQGKDKVRANRDGSSKDFTGTWTTTATLSTNVSMRTLLSILRESGGGGEQWRILEIDFDGVDKSKLNPELFRQLDGDVIQKNVGALGMVLGRYGVMNWESMFVRAEAIRRDITAKFELNIEERMFAMAYVAARLAGEVMRELDLLPVDLDAMEQMFGKTIKNLRTYVENNVLTPLDLAEEMMRELSGRMIVTENETDRRKDPKSVADYVVNHMALNRAVISGRIVINANRVYVVAQEFKDWAQDRGVDSRTLLNQWVEEGIVIVESGMKPVHNRLITTGVAPTQAAPIRTRTITLNLSKLSVDLSAAAPDNVVDMPSKRQAESAAAAAPAENNGTGE